MDLKRNNLEAPERFQHLRGVQYAQRVVNGEIIAGKYIILECIRFLKDLNRSIDENDNFEWEFDVGVYDVIMGFQNFFLFADGIMAGKPMKLADFQEWILANLFCWKHKEEGYIRFSRAYIQISRKQGKSMILGYIGFIKSLLEDYSQIYCCATKKDQAEIVIKEIKKMLDKAISCVKGRFVVYGKSRISKIVCKTNNSELAPLSADAQTLDGLGCDLAIIDEFGAHPDYSIYEVMRSSQTYKLSSQIVAITTAYPNLNTSPAYKERCILVDMYEGKSPMDERYFSAIYELDEGDDYQDRSVWVKSNPLFAQFPSIMKKMESDFENAQKDTEKLSLFLTKNLNVWLTQDSMSTYLDFDSWRAYQVDEIDFSGMEVIVGIDMSKSTDLTGVSIVAKDEEGRILVKSKAFLPEEIINLKEASDKLPYGSYITTGKEWVTATEGKFVKQDEVEAYVRSIESRYGCKIRCIAFDSWGALHLMSSLTNDYEVIDVKMTYKNFSPAIKKFREKVYEGNVIHEFNPILNFCVANALTKSDLQENILLDKKRSPRRIDLLVSTIIAYSEWFADEVEEEYSYFMV